MRGVLTALGIFGVVLLAMFIIYRRSCGRNILKDVMHDIIWVIFDDFLK